MPLPKDKESLLALRDQMQELKEMQAFRLLLEQFSNRLAQSQRLLESETELALVYRSQGEVASLRKDVKCWDSLFQEISTAISSIGE